MRYLLLGSNGQLGSDICDIWAKHNTKINCINRDCVDVTNFTKLREVLNDSEFDVLINCTSYHKTDEVEDNIEQAFKVNCDAVEIMALTCKEKRAKFVHISTDYVFGGNSAQRIPISESDYPSPVNVYGISKFHGENLAQLAWKKTTIFRVASLFGIRGASGKGGNFVETMIKFAKEKGKLRVVNDQIMSPTSTTTIARSIWKYLENQGEPGIFHCVNSGHASWFEFASRIIERVGIDAIITPCSSSEYPTRAKRPAYSVLCNEKLESVIGKIPHWHEALDEYLVSKGYS